MNLDLIHEMYAMVESNLHLEHFDPTGLTGGVNRSDLSARGADLPEGITLSSEVQIGHSIYGFRLS